MAPRTWKEKKNLKEVKESKKKKKESFGCGSKSVSYFILPAGSSACIQLLGEVLISKRLSLSFSFLSGQRTAEFPRIRFYTGTIFKDF